MAHSAHAFNSTEAHPLEIEVQAGLFDLWRVALRTVRFSKLTTATAAQIVLDSVASSVFDSLVGLTV
jgi:hypothetical protein